jgi:hypothetical protein
MAYVADQTVAPPGSEMVGQSIADWVDNLEKEITDPVFKKHGLNDIDPEAWYSLEIVVDIYQEILQSDGGGMALVAMGKASAGPVQEIFNFESFEEFLNGADKPFRAAIRNIPDEYGLTINRIADKHYKITNNSVVPNDMIYGYLWEILKLVRQPGQNYTFRPVSGYSPGSTERAVFELSWS